MTRNSLPAFEEREVPYRILPAGSVLDTVADSEERN
jgi:hypothetical protein